MGACVWSKLEKIHQDHHESQSNDDAIQAKLHKPNKMPHLMSSKAKHYSPDDSDANGDDDEAANENEEECVQYFFSDDLLRECSASKKIYGYVDQILPTVRSVILKK